MRLLVVVLDGMSYVFANVFCWWDKYLSRLWKLKEAKRTLMFIDTFPETPVVATQFFQLRKFYRASIMNWVWEYFDLRVAAVNIPVKIPALWVGVKKPVNWIDYFPLPKERFYEKLMELHNYVKTLKGFDVLIVWYPVPDEAHHYFFPTMHDSNSLGKAIKWYGISAKLALDLIDHHKPKKWVILSDHGFSSDRNDMDIRGRVHLRDGLAITNCGKPPTRSSKVVFWLYKVLSSEVG